MTLAEPCFRQFKRVSTFQYNQGTTLPQVTGKPKLNAKSGKTSYTPPVVLSENTVTRIEVQPHYYTRNNGTEDLSLKFNFYHKGRQERKWTQNKEKSFALKSNTVNLLHAELSKFLSLLGEKSGTKYLQIPVGEEDYDLQGNKPQEVLEALFNAIESNEGLIDGLANQNLSSEISTALKSRIRVSELENAISEFEALIPDFNLPETTFQKWFDEHYWVFGSAYIARDEVRSISAHDSVDILLERTANGLRDIVELKLPKEIVLHNDKGRKNYYLSAATAKAIGQCQRYLEVFTDEAKNGLRDNNQIVAHHPSAVIIIGRSHGWPIEKVKALNGINSRLNGIKIKTYDDVLAEAKASLRFLNPDYASEEKVFNEDSKKNFDLEDEIPF